MKSSPGLPSSNAFNFGSQYMHVQHLSTTCQQSKSFRTGPPEPMFPGKERTKNGARHASLLHSLLCVPGRRDQFFHRGLIN